MHTYRWILGTLLITFFPIHVHAAACNIGDPILPCEIGGTVYDTFAGNYTQNRSFYKASSYDISISNGYLGLTIRDGLPHSDGYAYIPFYYGPTVWTSPEPYNADFKVFGQFGGSNVQLANNFSWIGAGKIPPQSFGLFIGVRDPSPEPHPEFRGDVMASRLASAFSARPNSRAFTLTGDLSGSFGAPTDPILRSEIDGTFSEIRSLMKPGDTFTLYISGHGLSEGIIGGLGDEAVHVGDFVSDNWLATELQQFNGFRKMTFIDACHSGGFWGSGDVTELGGAEDLDQLENIALFAASGETTNTFYGSNGLPVFGLVLEEALLDPTERSASSLASFLELRQRELAADSYPVFYEAAFGSPTPVDPTLLVPSFMASADFDINSTVSTVPEPHAHLLFLIGLVALLIRTRLHA